jgi:hypothetical protein
MFDCIGKIIFPIYGHEGMSDFIMDETRSVRIT